MIKMDVRAEDEDGNFYDIEIQNHYRPIDFNRWEWYGAKNLTTQLVEGEYYDKIKPEYQLIITNFKGEANRRNKRLINRYVMRNEDGEVEQEHALINRTYVNLSRIDEIIKEKDPEKITDYENMCYLFKHNKSYGKIKPGKLVKAIMNKYEELKRDDKVWTLAEKVQEAEARERYLLRESKKEGESKGELKGIFKIISKQILKKYHQDASDWLYSLNPSQLEEIADLILTCNTLEELKKQIH